jgi:hypothetical protein
MASKNKHKPLRYIEVSRRNPITRILVGSGTSCCYSPVSGDVCLNIERAGASNCTKKVKYNACCQAEPVPLCEKVAAHVCALEIDEDGYAVFEWPEELFDLQEGWYVGRVMTGCNECGELPLRIGPRCNVIEVETVICGPDKLCEVGCPDECPDEICPTKTKGTGNIYTPDYEVL